MKGSDALPAKITSTGGHIWEAVIAMTSPSSFETLSNSLGQLRDSRVAIPYSSKMIDVLGNVKTSFTEFVAHCTFNKSRLVTAILSGGQMSRPGLQLIGGPL